MLKSVAVIMVCVACFSFSAGPAFAAEKGVSGERSSDAELDEVFKWLHAESVVTTSIATGSPEPLHRAPAVATVITAEDIEAIGATTLDEVLETVPGLHVMPSRSVPAHTTYSIRGVYTSLTPQTLLMVNGIPIVQLFAGGRPVGMRIPVEGIARVEVIRGPGSALYGADAFSGVINVVTKGASDIGGTRMGARVGSFDTYDGWAQHGGTRDGWDVALSLERQQGHSDPDRIIKTDSQTLVDQVTGSHASLAPGALSTPFKLFDGHVELVHDHWTVRQWVMSVDEFGLGLSDTLALSPDSKENGATYLTDVTYRNAQALADWDMMARFSYLNMQDESFIVSSPKGSVLSVGQTVDALSDGAQGRSILFSEGALMDRMTTDHQGTMELSGIFSGFNQHSLRLGAGYRYLWEENRFKANFDEGLIDTSQNIVGGTLSNIPQGPLAEGSRQVWFAYLQDEWIMARNWELTAGLRYDHYSDFGVTVNPRVGLVWQTSSSLTTKLLYGTAFRAPSFSELRATEANLGAAVKGDLKEETIHTVELAFDYRPTPRLRTGLNLFHYDADGLIERVFEDGGSQPVLKNSIDLRGYGLEMEADWSITEALRLYGNFSYQYSKDKNTGERNPDTPAMKLYLNPSWKFPHQWSLGAQVFWIGERVHPSGDTRSDPKDYTLVNVILRRKNIAKHWDVALSVRNVFDEDAVESIPFGTSNEYPLPGRSVFGEIRYSF